jgi:hypothetical protein
MRQDMTNSGVTKMANRPVFNNNAQRKQSRGGDTNLVATVMAMLGLGGHKLNAISGPAVRRKSATNWRNHLTGVGEAARRVRQGLAGMNMHLVANPSQDFEAAQTREARDAQCIKCHPQSRRALRLVAFNG